MTDLVKQYFRALRDRDGVEMSTLVAADVICFDPIERTPREGRDELRRHMEDPGEPLVQLAPTEEFVFVCGDAAAVKWTAALDGHPRRAGGQVEGITVLEINGDGLIQTVWGYWDPGMDDTTPGVSRPRSSAGG